MLTDTDVCYRGDMLAALDRSPYTVVVNGNPDSVNIGLLYGKRTPGVPESEDHALRCARSGQHASARQGMR